MKECWTNLCVKRWYNVKKTCRFSRFLSTVGRALLVREIYINHQLARWLVSRLDHNLLLNHFFFSLLCFQRPQALKPATTPEGSNGVIIAVAIRVPFAWRWRSSKERSQSVEKNVCLYASTISETSRWFDLQGREIAWNGLKLTSITTWCIFGTLDFRRDVFPIERCLSVKFSVYSPTSSPKSNVKSKARCNKMASLQWGQWEYVSYSAALREVTVISGFNNVIRHNFLCTMNWSQ